MSSRRVKLGDVYADILLDYAARQWVYVVHGDTSHELIAMGKRETEAEATRIATETIQQYRIHAVNRAAAE